jgi:hypothetical protein
MPKQKKLTLDERIKALHDEIETLIGARIDADIKAGVVGLPRGVMRMCMVGQLCPCEAYRKLMGK